VPVIRDGIHYRTMLCLFMACWLLLPTRATQCIADEQPAALPSGSLSHQRQVIRELLRHSPQEATELLVALVESPDSTRRTTGLKVLAELRTPEALPTLRANLDHPDVQVRSAAAWALGEIGDVTAVPMLLPWLAQPHKSLRWSAARALGRLKAQEAVPALLSCLGDADAGVREAAVWALGETGGAFDRQSLISALADAQARVADAAVVALVQLGDSPLPLLLPVLQGSHPQARTRATTLLGRLGEGESQAPLVGALQDRDATVRQQAALALGHLGPRLIVHLTQQLETSEPTLQETLLALEALPAVLVQPLIDSLQDQDWRVAAGSVWALAEVGAKVTAPPDILVAEEAIETRVTDLFKHLRASMVAPLLRTLTHAQPAVRRQAAGALGTIKAAAAAQLLSAALQDVDRDVRWQAAQALGQLADPAAVGPLAEALQDREPMVREHALWGLGRLRAQVATAEIGQRLHDINPFVRRAAARVLGHLGSTDAASMLTASLRDRDPLVRRHAAASLGLLGDRSAIAPLVQASQDTHVHVRRSAVEALVLLRARQALPALEERAEQDEDQEVRRIARIGADKLRNL
jgi:HEAT repeat protein